MKTYDNGASTHGTRPFFQSAKGVITRFFNRERELISLRNAVGMMSEARRGDSSEYHEMREALLQMRERNARFLEALTQIAGSSNKTLTDQQWADHLQRMAQDAIDV